MGDGRPAEVSAFVFAAGRRAVRVRGDLGTGGGEDAGELRDPDDGAEHGRAAISSPDAGAPAGGADAAVDWERADRKSTRLNSSHRCISYAVFCLKKKKRNA